jgi:hypothetical protein
MQKKISTHIIPIEDDQSSHAISEVMSSIATLALNLFSETTTKEM